MKKGNDTKRCTLSLSFSLAVQRRATSSSQSASLLSLSASLVSSSSSCLTLLYACGACLAARVLCNCLCSLIEFKCVAQYAILQNAAQTHTQAAPPSLTLTHTHVQCAFDFVTRFGDLQKHFACDNQTKPTLRGGWGKGGGYVLL